MLTRSLGATDPSEAIGFSFNSSEDSSKDVRYDIQMLTYGNLWQLKTTRIYRLLWWSSYFGQFDKFDSCRLMLESNG